MEAPDTRGAGGKALRGRGASSTPGKLLGMVSSPLQLISKTVKGLVGSDKVSPSGTRAATGFSPPLQPQKMVSPATEHATGSKADDGPASFSFPTLAGSSDSPPASTLLRAAPAAPASQSDTQAHTPPGTASPPGTTPTKELTNGWSPSKLASLNFFLLGASQPKVAQEAAKPSAPAALPSSDLNHALEIFRPYQGLKVLMRSGPGGFVSGADGAAVGTAQQASDAGGGQSTTARPSMGSSLRYNPYARPNMGRPPRPGSNGGSLKASLPGPSQPLAAQPSGLAQTAGITSQWPANQPTSIAVAAGQLPPVNPRQQLPPAGPPPRPPGVPGGIRLAPGQVAFSSGRTGTPLPKLGQFTLQAMPPSQQPAAQTPGGFRPLLGAVGGKRPRDSPAASPLMAAGVRNLSDFKRRRQATQQQPRSVLAGLAARTPRADVTPGGSGGERTPGGAGTSGTPAMATPLSGVGVGAVSDVPVTDTARKILETLENFSRAADHAANAGTPIGTGLKPAAQPTPRSSAPSSNQLPGAFMPPLDRLDQNHFGGTPSSTLGAGWASIVSGEMPSPAVVVANAGSTPGPRMVLDFQSPASSPAPQACQAPAAESGAPFGTPAKVVTTPLPLSPITVPPVSSAADRAAPNHVTEAAAGLAASGAAARSATNDVDATPAAGEAASTSSVEASTRLQESSVPQYSFRDPIAPSDSRLRTANDAASQGAAAAAAAAGAADAPLFTFSAPTVSISRPAEGGASGAAAASTIAPVKESTPSAPSTGLLNEVQKAAAIPLPDDDDEEEEEAGGATAAPAAAAAAPAPTVAETRPGALPFNFKPVMPPASKRVMFAEAANDGSADKPAEATEKGAAKPSATPPATPGGFFSAHAGSTPFRPLGSVPVTTEPAEKATPAGDKPLAFSFGAAAEPAKAAANLDNAAAPAVNQPSAPSLFSFGAPPASGPAAAASSAPAVAPAAPVFGASSSSASFSFGAAGSTTAATTNGTQPAPSQPGSITTFGAPASSASGFAFGAPAAAPVAAAAAPTGTTPSFSFGAAPAQAPASAAATAASAAPAASAAAASVPTFTFGAAPAAASSAPAASTGFMFGAASSAPTVPPPAAAAPAPAAPTFAFGASATATTAPPATFGSPLPAATASSAPAFGSSQPAGGFGGFGGSSAPSTSFTFGAQASGAAMSSSGFGAQPTPSTSSSTFSFGSSAPPPTFGASAAAPSFGSAPASQPAFGASAPTFGAAGPANPFGAAAPTLFAAPAQPTFGASPGFGSAAPAPVPSPSFGGFSAAAGSNAGAPAPGMFGFGGGATPTFGASQAAPAPAPMFGQAAAPAPSFGAQAPQPATSPSFGGFGAPAPAPAPGGFGGFGAQAPPAFGGAPPSPGGDVGGGFSLGAGDPKDGRKRVKARRHGH